MTLAKTMKYSANRMRDHHGKLVAPSLATAANFVSYSDT
jgi:hypothetical protein